MHAYIHTYIHTYIQVTVDQVQAYAQSIGSTVTLTSSRDNEGIDDLFLDIAKELLARAPEGLCFYVRACACMHIYMCAFMYSVYMDLCACMYSL